MRPLLVLVFPLLPAAAPAPAHPSIPLAAARAAFEEMREASDRDAGRLWGVRLYGPTLFVDPETRFVVANQADGERLLEEKAGVFTGRLPDAEAVANTAHRWAGVTWTMVMWPLPENRYARLRLLLHESFHRVAPEIGVPGSNPANAHLDTEAGRAWLRLEWRALAEALIRAGEERRRAIGDAFAFRAHRRSLFPKAGEEERLLELNEGLAEYTGTALCGWPEPVLADRAAVRLEQDERGSGFVRSFAYTSGPAYGVLLDESSAGWRARIDAAADLGALLAAASKWAPPADLAAEAASRAAAYDGEVVFAQEGRREASRREAIARHRARFLDGPVLLLPLSEDVSYTYDPYTVEALGDAGSVYGTTTVNDRWGKLEVSKGALITRGADGRVVEARVPAPSEASGSPLSGDGWTLALAAGWRVVPGARTGDSTVAVRE